MHLRRRANSHDLYKNAILVIFEEKKKNFGHIDNYEAFSSDRYD